MKVDPSALLIGPRGRRLCLDMVGSAIEDDGSQAAEEYRLAVFYAAYDLDPGRGTSRVMFSGGGGEPVTPHPSPADVARLLDVLPLVEPDEPMLVRALAAAVDFARYWQEPDGEDVVAAAPEMRPALARVAAGVAQSPFAAWWTTPLELTTQWTVTFMDGPSHPAATVVAASAGELLAHWHSKTMESEATARRERPRDPRASWSGTWWSTPPAELTRTTRSLGEFGPVGLWLVEDAFNWDRATTRQVSASRDVTVYEVEGPEAWAELCRRYPLEVTASRRHDWYRTTEIDTGWVIPDWSRVAADFDAVHVTVLGYLTTAGRAVAVSENLCTVLAGWNPDQTYWLTDSITPVSIEQSWRRNDNDDTWSQFES